MMSPDEEAELLFQTALKAASAARDVMEVICRINLGPNDPGLHVTANRFATEMLAESCKRGAREFFSSMDVSEEKMKEFDDEVTEAVMTYFEEREEIRQLDEMVGDIPLPDNPWTN